MLYSVIELFFRRALGLELKNKVPLPTLWPNQLWTLNKSLHLPELHFHNQENKGTGFHYFQGAFDFGDQRFLTARLGTLLLAKTWRTPPKFVSKNSETILTSSESNLFGLK